MSAPMLPATIGPFAEMISTTSGAGVLATDLRAVAIGVKDVQQWAQVSGAPIWSGRAREAHDHARTRFAIRLDQSEAALERAVVAADRFDDRLARLSAQRRRLEAERGELNEAILVLTAEVQGAVDDTRDLEFLRRAAGLATSADGLRVAIAGWVGDYLAAEADLVAALGRVDTVAEGRAAAADPARPDVAPLVRRLARLLDDPAALAAWWAGLSRVQRQLLTTEHPRLVGNAGGVPTRHRDRANRAALQQDLDRLQQRDRNELTEVERRVLANAEHVRDALEDHGDLRDPSGDELLHLLGYDPSAFEGDGGVVVSIGDPDTADHVSVTVPGFTTETASLVGHVEDLIDLYESARDSAYDGGGDSVAAVYWGDYDAPSGFLGDPLDHLGVADDGRAEAGGERLADFLDGLEAADRGESAHVTAVGHSYGSTTLGHALVDGADVDDAVLLGSPGVPAGTAGGLGGAPIWVGSMDNDPISLLGQRGHGPVLPFGLGHDPADGAFGAHRFDAGDGSPLVQDLLDNHSDYFEGTSLENLGHIVAGNDDQVSDQPRRGEAGGGYRTLDDLLIGATTQSGGRWLVDRKEDLVPWLRDVALP